MITSDEIRKGVILDIEAEPYVVLDWQRIVEGRQAPKIRLKLRHLRTRAIIERTQEESKKLKVAPVDRLTVIFMYWDGELYHFMDIHDRHPNAPDELLLSADKLGEASKYIVDNLQLSMFLLHGEPMAVDLPESIVMRVKAIEEPESGHDKRATMEGPARIETGLVVQVPPFISIGDRIRVNTEDGKYIDRA
jgi:elongation factor P